MPTQVTYPLPGHQRIGEGMPLRRSVMLTVHSQVTLSAPAARKVRTTCRQAAIQVAGGTCR